MAANIPGILCVFGGFLIHLTLGTFYTFGNMSTYMTSYFYHRVDPTVDYSKSIWINALAYVGQGSLMIIGGILERKIGGRKTVIIGCIMFSGSTALTYYAIQYHFWGTAVLYGLISGIGLGIAYVPPLVNGMKWFPERKGLVNGIIVGGYGMGAFVFNQVQTIYLNPDNSSPDKEDGYFRDEDVMDRVPSMFLLLGAIYAIIEILGIVILFPAPSENSKKVYLSMEKIDQSLEQINETKSALEPLEQKSEETKNGPKKNKPEGMGIRAMLRQKEFYMLWLTFALNAQCILFLNTMYKAFGQTFIQDDQFLSMVGSGASLFNSIGRVAWGQLQDKLPYKKCMLALCASLTVFMLSFVLTPQGGKFVFTLWVFAIFFSFSGLFVLLPTATSDAFGPKNVGANYGIVFTGPAVSSLLGAQLVGIMQHALGWFGSFCYIAALSSTAFGITLLFPEDPKTVLARHVEAIKRNDPETDEKT